MPSLFKYFSFSDKDTFWDKVLKIRKFCEQEKLTQYWQKLNEIAQKKYYLRNGVNLLGYKVFYYFKLLRKSNIWKAIKRLQQLHNLLKEQRVSTEYTTQSINGWLAYAKVGNTCNLRKKMLKQFKEFNIKI
ncbi:MAG: hypothetical protein QW403_03180 [Candidatus Aenigmatarchaeota archaeon]